MGTHRAHAFSTNYNLRRGGLSTNGYAILRRSYCRPTNNHWHLALGPTINVVLSLSTPLDQHSHMENPYERPHLTLFCCDIYTRVYINLLKRFVLRATWARGYLFIIVIIVFFNSHKSELLFLWIPEGTLFRCCFILIFSFLFNFERNLVVEY